MTERRSERLGWWHRKYVFWPVAVGLVLALLLLSACVSFDYKWQQTRAPSTKPWIYAHALDVDLACRGIGADPQRKLARINGCAQWHPAACLIILPENAPAWLRAHEERHCEGWQHD